MKEMKKYRKAPLSCGHLPKGEREDACLPARQGRRELQLKAGLGNLLTSTSNFLAPLSTLAKGDEIRFSGSEGVVTPANVGKENKEHRIRKSEIGKQKSEVRIRNLTSNDTSTSFLSPSPFGEGRGEAKYKTFSRLPQESGFNSGDCPGAAAITIFYSFYSSPRVSPNFAGTTQKNLPVANQQAFHQGSIVPNVPLVRGTKSAGWQIGGGIRGTSPDKSGRRGYLPFHRNLMFEALNQKGGTPMS